MGYYLLSLLFFANLIQHDSCIGDYKGGSVSGDGSSRNNEGGTVSTSKGERRWDIIHVLITSLFCIISIQLSIVEIEGGSVNSDGNVSGDSS